MIVGLDVADLRFSTVLLLAVMVAPVRKPSVNPETRYCITAGGYVCSCSLRTCGFTGVARLA